ncbi:beta-ketoacyl-ACP synthase III [Candidatus Synechococcus spongiarum]|uniref:Beta-ketoacyl-[acyl-carrier-protein] synthase III n=1 Tax=Candidatus Synechococcus spongiarum TaxID=431041 RepID=A0A171DI45_9SYNE|nr:beta-ketoacyl-ACP synthase III [Candidatus Synechococcus spongiarum]SAY40008.1 3-oxoacyl-[acyl-carrier-protein] synthase,KASIII (EC 2.3.1.180) [Candidatus Synechococcus spongiarum]
MSAAVGIALTGSGAATPARVVTNGELSLWLDTSDAWICSRTGIAARRIAMAEDSLESLSSQAARQALERAGWRPDQVDLILLATSSPDDLFGSAPAVQAALGADNAVAFDLTAACSGFLFALITAAQYIRSGTYRRVLVVGADLLSRWVDWQDRRTCVLFGDGAGAVAMEAAPESWEGLLAMVMRTDGHRRSCLTMAHQATSQVLHDQLQVGSGGFQPIAMDGQEVYKFAVQQVPLVLTQALKQAGLTAEHLDWLLLHQANERILASVAQRLDIPAAKVLSNLKNYGNTSAATIPLMLHEAVAAQWIRPGHLIASSGFGAGLSWGAALLRWGRPEAA